MQTEQIKRINDLIPRLLDDLHLVETNDRFLMISGSADSRPILKRGRLLLQTISRIPFEMMSQQTGAQFVNQVDILNKRLPPIAEFVHSESQVPQNLQSMLAECTTAILSIFEITSPYIATLVYIVGEWNERLDKAVRTAHLDSEEMHKLLKQLEKKRDEADEIISKARSAAALAAVSSHAQHFADEADRRGTESKKWLVTAILAAGLSIIGAGCFFLLPVPSGANMVPYVAGRMFILSILVFATVWSGRNYRALRHLQMVNTHRSISLRTFEAFVDAAEGNVDVRNAVLLETTRSIFSSIPTGFLESKDSGGEVQSHWIEIAKSFKSGS